MALNVEFACSLSKWRSEPENGRGPGSERGALTVPNRGDGESPRVLLCAPGSASL